MVISFGLFAAMERLHWWERYVCGWRECGFCRLPIWAQCRCSSRLSIDAREYFAAGDTQRDVLLEQIARSNIQNFVSQLFLKLENPSINSYEMRGAVVASAAWAR